MSNLQLKEFGKWLEFNTKINIIPTIIIEISEVGQSKKRKGLQSVAIYYI